MTKQEQADNAGCWLVIGAVIVGIAVGNLTEAEYGWLTLGGLIILFALLSIPRGRA